VAHPTRSSGSIFALSIPEIAPACTPTQLSSHPPDADPDPFDSAELGDLASCFPGASYKAWLADLAVTWC